MKQLTLCLIHEHLPDNGAGPRVLLGMKKRGFGEGRWNGFGGKVDDGETIEEAALREIREECGIEATEIDKRGVLIFNFQDDTKIGEVHVFHITKYTGEPIESEEMRPQWFTIDEIPFSQMWPDDEHWLPLFLAGKKFRGRFLFDKPSTNDYTSQILEKELIEVEKL
ncbi:MAG: hypothetical protein COU11_02985 [Candidatus Harrisonbacteria bacterium CG10_big_fil_rev_8_21_14_0_10_49_15]|uniref:Oxidized purine nucleoside triphosphate hydrolase n=1 Tax=Candidatus Harrisonbacteria bacterium CG10_big_fil_rev_8_21_14_0_10_49_15 TaxID=1974587 RepID=A0A2H0UKM0_9BACT|nr:MAG: hypothetical protein COU11_02985 [Candidatus Harrisonbacteria bacterium CG10_big_fil_rev_8_21_14_0_10_49_15]